MVKVVDGIGCWRCAEGCSNGGQPIHRGSLRRRGWQRADSDFGGLALWVRDLGVFVAGRSGRALGPLVLGGAGGTGGPPGAIED
jgi:hypothetical protein